MKVESRENSSDTTTIDPELAAKFDLSYIDANKKQEEFRNYADTKRAETVRRTYELMRTHQTVEFVQGRREKWLALNKGEFTIMEALHLLDDLVDDSDPDTAVPNSFHAFQTAERIRKEYPNEDWFHLVGLIHDLGKVLALWGEPQWATVGDTCVVGAAPSEKCVYSEYFVKNPDTHNPKYNTPNGIYTANCGLDNVLLSWGHDEYLYNVLKMNKSTIPEKGLRMIRYHSFYPWHTSGAYRNLCNEQDEETLKWVNDFNRFDLYSKSDELPDPVALTPYYQSLIDKYCPGKLRF
ncbi:myo-inositol oxygenase [Capsaspora owczarzaki ATCC 30864]|uniref:Inositol oxygenase n=1 Tax=Capsaspora owczarzaki (strain ATCC 30864) TaxID=595528 RepID=A0A0D2VYF6_CAPO3|nr:myo-inositol oxygenase [Capsaspora owczarzaki ATCC 30864]KJE96752.1 myo-inositol oxygenase [Capsaspora owczarzaki ATCC 30864]|eukprot:XP_004343748.1 myo-inositol oxygenase [Capsaspora owczarzaki ATCC 30864]